MTAHTTVLTLTSVDDEVPATARFSLDKGLALRELADHITALSGGRRTGTVAVVTDNGTASRATGAVALSGVGGTAATGSYALSGVGGTAAAGAITFSGSTGAWTVTVNGVAFNGTSAGVDSDEAADLAAQITASVDVAIAGVVTAIQAGDDVDITAVAKGTAGNAITLAVTGTGVSRSAATLSGGAQGAVTVVINGTSVGPVNVTNQTDTAAATTVAAAIEANGTLGPLLVAVGSTTNVSLTWGAKGTAGNAVTLAAGTSATGTATRSGATLSGGAQGSVGVTIGGTTVTTDTTNLTDTAATTAVAAAITANTTVNKWVTASGSSTTVTIRAILYGLIGNSISLSSTSATGTATSSGGRLTGGTADTSAVTVTF